MPTKTALSNRHIAVQIKSGPSFIKEDGRPKNYSMDNSHYEYWLISDRPVIFVVHNPSTCKTYWTNIEFGLKPNKSSKYTLSVDKELTENSISEFEQILISYAPILSCKINPEESLDYFELILRGLTDYQSLLVKRFEYIIAKISSISTESLCSSIDVMRVETLLQSRLCFLYIAGIYSQIELFKNKSVIPKIINLLEMFKSAMDNFIKQIEKDSGKTISSELNYVIDLCRSEIEKQTSSIDLYIEIGNNLMNDALSNR